jgi:hypothetical protein
MLWLVSIDYIDSRIIHNRTPVTEHPGMNCTACGKLFGAADPVYRTRVHEKTRQVWTPETAPRYAYNKHFDLSWVSLAPVCEVCHPTSAYLHWSDPVPCAGCARPLQCSFVRQGKGARTCSYQCWLAVEAAKRRHKREYLTAPRAAEKVCVMCGLPFVPTRSNATTCSQKCRRKAYQQRHRA